MILLTENQLFGSCAKSDLQAMTMIYFFFTKLFKLFLRDSKEFFEQTFFHSGIFWSIWILIEKFYLVEKKRRKIQDFGFDLIPRNKVQNTVAQKLLVIQTWS